MPKKSIVPRASIYMKKKRIDEFSEKPWVYLEREMKEKAEKGIQPYNKKVGDWLVFLRDLKVHYRTERQENAKQLNQARGPSWFVQFSPHNLKVVARLRSTLHKDVVTNGCHHSLTALRRLGITLKFPEEFLVAAIKHSREEPGVFLWSLFTMYYKKPPSQPLHKYNTNAKLLMSAIVFVDIDDCIKELDKLTRINMRPLKPAPKKRKPTFTPNVQFGEYLAHVYLPPCKTKPPPKTRPVVDYKLKLLEDEVFETLAKKSPDISINKRLQIVEKKKRIPVECKYKFWEPPLSIRISDPKEIEYICMLKMFKNKPKPPPKLPYENIQCHIGSVTYSGSQPQYQLHNYTGIPTGYIIHNGGQVRMQNDNATNILGFVKFPRDSVEACLSTCNCVEKWPAVKKHIVTSKCKCGHRYDFYNKADGKPIRKYFSPPTRYRPYELDLASVAECDSKPHLIRKLVDGALKSESETAQSYPTIDLKSVSPKVLLKSLLGDLMESPLLIPHLPKSFLLPNIQAWVRKRIKGPIGPKLKNRLLLQSKRAWVNIDNMNFRPRAHRIPFSVQNMPNYDISHRKLIQEIREREFKELANKTKVMQLRLSNMFWPTMRYDDFPNESFLRAYSAYMTQPEKPLYIYNPHNPTLFPKLGKTCPITI